MKSLLLATTALSTALAAIGSASAADMPVKAPVVQVHNWTGAYVGLNVGYAWGRSEAKTAIDCAPPPGGLLAFMCNPAGFGAANVAAVNASGTGSMNDGGFTGGIQAGFNLQNNNLVYGLEIDFGAMSLRGSRQVRGAYPLGGGLIAAGDLYAVGYSFATDWLATFRGRVGLAIMPNLLAYGTGGLALTRLSVANSFLDNVFAGSVESASESKVKAGWTIGAGLEWAQSRDWTVKAEYLYVDFNKIAATGLITNATLPGYGQGISTSSDLTAHIARVGVNRRF